MIDSHGIVVLAIVVALAAACPCAPKYGSVGGI